MANNITSPTDVFAPDLVMQLADERLFNDTTVLNTEYVVDARNNASLDHSANNVVFPYFSDVTGNSGVQSNPGDGTALDSDGIRLGADVVPLQRGIYNFGADASAWRNLSNVVSPDGFLADSYVEYMQQHLLREVFAKLDAVTNVKDISGGTDEAAYVTLKAVKEQSAKWFGEKARVYPPLVITHSSTMYDFENDAAVVKANYHNNTDPSQTPWMGLAGFNFVTSDLVKVSGTGAAQKYTSYVLLPGAVQMYVNINQDMFGHTVRVPNTSVLNTVFTFDYAVHIRRDRVIPAGRLISKASINAA